MISKKNLNLFIVDGFKQIKLIKNIDNTLGVIPKFSKAKKIPMKDCYIEVMKKLRSEFNFKYGKMYFEDTVGSMDGVRYGTTAMLHQNSLVDLLNSMEERELNDDRTLLDEISIVRVCLHCYLSNVIKALDSVTNLWRINAINKQMTKLLNSNTLDEPKRQVIDSIISNNIPSYDVKYICQQNFKLTQEGLRDFVESFESYIIEPISIFEDPTITYAYQKIVPKYIRDEIAPYIYSVCQADIQKIISLASENPLLLEEYVDSELLENLSDKQSEMSVMEDYESLYSILTKNSSIEIRSADISRLDLGILCEAIILDKVTERLVNEIRKPKELKGTGVFDKK